MNISINPSLTSVASGSFNTSSDGFVQGMMLDDPAIRNQLAGGTVKSTETLPMWGGIGITELVSNSTQGGNVSRATALTGSTALTGFTVFNQAHGMINSPQSPVPTAAPGMSVNFFRLGSGARIAVACDPVLASLAGTDIITTAVAWDFVNQLLIPQVTSVNISALTYVSGTGVVTLTTATAHGIGVGDTITTASITGTGSIAATIGTFTTIAGTTGSTIKYTIATGLTLAYTSGGTVTTGSALSVKLLDLNIGNSMTVSYDSVTGFATWNRSGSTAIILI